MDHQGFLTEDHYNRFSGVISESIRNSYYADLHQLLKMLTENFKRTHLREYYRFVHGALLNVLQHFAQRETSVEKEIMLHQLFICIRNAVAGNPSNQNLCIQTPSFCTVVWNMLLANLELLYRLEDSTELKDKVLSTICSGIQCFGNMIVQNPTGKCIMWSVINSKILNFLACPDEKLCTYSSFLLYNCLYEMPEITNDVITNVPFTIQALELMTNLPNSEWNDFFVDYLIKYPHFLPIYYPNLSKNCRHWILSLVESEIKRANSTTGDGLVKAVEYVADIYLEKCNMYYNSDLQSEESTCELLNLLDILGTASAASNFIIVLQQRQSILAASVILLRAIHDAGKAGNVLFESATKSSSDDHLHPAYGFKRDLISLIGNLCYRNRQNQDEVRELGGLHLLLNCTGKLDRRNKFMNEWVVLAVRNLCENNLENQKVISDLQRQGTVDEAILQQLQSLKMNE